MSDGPSARQPTSDSPPTSSPDYRLLFEAANDAILILDPRTETILDANPKACAMYGGSRAALVGRSLKALTRDPARGERELRRLCERGASEHFESVHLGPNGREIPVLINGSLIEFGGRPAILAIVRDMTEYHRLRTQLLQAQKLETLGRLAGVVAHDFNNILTVILGGCELLSETASERGGDELREMKRAAERAARLTRQLLAFSRKQPLEPRVICLRDAVRALEPLLGRLIGESVRLDVSVPEWAVPVRIDPVQFEQVLLNLAANARDAMPQGGRLSIVVRTEWIQPDGPTPSPLEPGCYAVVDVSDTGVGMPPEVRERLFEPFFTTKGASGTGLGLSTVYGIVTQQGGRIDVASAPGCGTTFTLYLPLTEDATSRSAEGPSERAPQPDVRARRGETILVVEDDEAVRWLLARELRQSGYRVLEADGAEAAERWAAQPSLVVDLLLADLVLPGMSGAVLAERLRARWPALRVLLMSGYGEHPALGEAGDRELLHKPFDAEALARRVRAVLDDPPAPAGTPQPPAKTTAARPAATPSLKDTGWYWIGSLTVHPWQGEAAPALAP